MSEAKNLNGYQLAHILIRLMAIFILVDGLYWALPTIGFFMSLTIWGDDMAAAAMNERMFIVSLIQPLIKIVACAVLWFGSRWFSQNICPAEVQEVEVPVTADTLKSTSIFIAGLVLLYISSKGLISALNAPDSGSVWAGVLPWAIPILIALSLILFPSAVVSGITKIAGLIGAKRNRF